MKTLSFFTGLVLFIIAQCGVYANTSVLNDFGNFKLLSVTPTIAKANGLHSATGVFIINPSYNSGKNQITLKTGDIILALNGRDVKKPSDFSNDKLAKETGEFINYKIWRDRKVHFLSLRKPNCIVKETSSEIDVLNDEVSFMLGAIRCVVTKPKGFEKAPAILLVQSGNSGPVCNVDESNTYRQLTDNLTKKGYVCMRMENVGTGECMDQVNTNNVDAFLETLAFEKALKQLKKYSFVDSTKIFLLGHFTGGKISQLLASRNNVKGVIVYGSNSSTPSEYLSGNIKDNLIDSGYNREKTATILKDCQKVIKGILVDKNDLSDFAATNQELIPIMRKYFNWNGEENFMGRNIAYIQSLERMNSWSYLSIMKTNLLVLHGSADIKMTDNNSVKEMVDVYNFYRPGAATLIELPGLDHNFANVGSLKKSYELEKFTIPGKTIALPVDDAVISSIDKWINQLNA
jgi:dienelactone hydrolase